MSSESIKVPDLGGADNVEVIELCVTVGDQVDEGQSLVVVESDKASMDIPSPASGKVLSIVVSEGAEVSEGDVLVELETADVQAELSSPASDSSSESVSPAVSEIPAATSDSAVDPDADEVISADTVEPAIASTTETVLVPDLGGADSVELIELLVAVGDEVVEGDGLMALESDKASMDLPAPVSGKVAALLVEVGATLSEGMPIALIDSITAGSNTAKQQSVADVGKAKDSLQRDSVSRTPAPAQKPSGVAMASRVPAVEQPGENVYAGPAVRKLARELGVTLERVEGTGPKGRISKDDLHDYLRAAVSNNESGLSGTAATSGAGIPVVPPVDFSQFGEVDSQPMSKMHKLTAANMHRSWLNVPHVTQFDDADITDLEVFRNSLKPEMEKRGIKISPLPFIMKAVARALAENPIINSSLGEDGESLVYKKYVHIGMAVDTPAGLLVPVIRDVDKKGIWEVGAEVLELAQLAKERKLKPAQMQGGCFTVSSLGGIGGQGFTPIVNTPEVAILGVSRLQTKPVFSNGEFVPRKMLPVSLSYDHRVVNGGDAGRFLTSVCAYLAEMRRMLL